MSRIYTVRLVRPVFQQITVEVQAWSRNSAEQKALRQTKTFSESDWETQEFDDSEYSAHVHSSIDHQAIYERSTNPHREIREFRSGRGKAGKIRYLLLAADDETRTGHLLLQPWFAHSNEHLQADYCSDWSEPISFIVENDGMKNGDSGVSPHGKKYDGDNIVDFPSLGPCEEFVESKS